MTENNPSMINTERQQQQSEGGMPEGAMKWLKSYPPGVAWDSALPVTPVFHMLDAAASQYPERLMLDFLGKKYRYGTIANLVARAAKGLQNLGAKPGVKIGLFLPNCPYFVIFYFAVLKTGATLVNYNPLYAAREIEHQIADSDTDIMVTLDLAPLMNKLHPMLGKTGLRHLIICPFADCLPWPKNWLFPVIQRKNVARWNPSAQIIPYRAVINNDGKTSLPSIDPARDIALLQYTGGTTGTPKGAMLSHANVVANAWQSAIMCANSDATGGRCIAVLPFFHSFAMTAVMNWSIITGAEMILLPRYQLSDLLKAIRRTKPTYMAGVPTIFTDMIQARDLKKYWSASMKYAISGGAALPLEVAANFERLTGCTLIEGYGLSEASPVVSCNPFQGIRKPGSIGIPYPQTSVTILSIDPPHRPMTTGERGEICVKGPQVMAGYWKQPDETVKVMHDGWLHTGDVGYMDDDGYIFVTDRLKEMINASGFKVYPRMVEEVIYRHPAVAECAVVGVPDPHRGQTVKAFVVVRQGQSLTTPDLLAFLTDKLSPIEMPKQVEFKESLPKSAIGKILKKTLTSESSAEVIL